MQCDWSARLDPRGYHRCSVTRPDVGARWVGDTTLADDGWTEGTMVEIYDTKNEQAKLLLSVGGCAYLTGSRKGQPAEIILITDIFSNGLPVVYNEARRC